MRLAGLIAPMTAAALAWVAMPAIAGAADPTGPADGPAAMERAYDVQSRETLAASIPARERKLAARERSDVVAEVAERARQLGLPGTMDAELLADLLYERAVLQLDLDRCAVGQKADCTAARRALGRVERRFATLTGLSAADFKSGGPLAGARAGRSAGDGVERTGAKLLPICEEDPGAPGCGGGGGGPVPYDVCICDVWGSSIHRWMEPWWALECNNHGGHGVCSGNVDSAHGTGCGAMTGWIAIYKDGGHVGTRECPDDHFTCFRGPSRCDDGGSWGNVCSCDTLHSQLWDAGGEWYAGRLEDDVDVFQLAVSGLVYVGACGQSTIYFSNFVNENDPVCCDDSLGTLIAPTPTALGTTTRDVPASAVNCDGGSRSGVYPYCGKFGATYRITTSCRQEVRYY